ncbi:uncharacterized protein F54H12.2-like [Saccostrea echinata]|uniref:uncharacterized protein F54H12.2-like n=1 Tax=Saccostrea echinata TaxID=191078 RepID=UPI002A80EFC5|nr:uncharacterized protein F54H12.2-like [Saccostrea echinata]
MEQLDSSLTLFQKDPQDTGVLSRDYVEYRPVNQLTDDSPLGFNIPATSINYIDLKKTRLHVRLQLLKPDGNPVDQDDPVGLVNSPLNSIFSQVDLQLQQQPVSQLGTNYPYKAYLDSLLGTDRLTQESKLSSEGFIPDSAGFMDDPNPKTGGNSGLFMRYNFTKEGKVVDFEGPLFLDVCQQDRLMLNGVPLQIKLWPHTDNFRLLCTLPGFKVHLRDACLKICVVKPNPGVLLGHGEAIKKTPALYPFSRSNIKTYSLSPGHFAFNADDLFQGEVPNTLVIGCVSSVAYNGTYNRSPFNFQHFYCSFLNFSVDGRSVPSRALQPDFENNTYIEAYETLFANTEKAINISRGDYPKGYCLYVINCQDGGNLTTLKKGHTRLEMKFAHALIESVTIILYATFPHVMQIDQARNVYF